MRLCHHDRSDDIVLLVAAQDAKPWSVADRDLPDILHQYRDAVFLCQDHILDVFDLVAFGQIVAAAIINQTDTADIDRLLANADFASAHIDVRVAQRRQDLRHRDVVAFQLVRIDFDLKFLGGAAPTVDGCNAGNGQQPARDDPILNRAQVGDSEMLRTDDLIAIDFPSRAVRLDRRHQIAWQADVLLHRDRCLAVGEVIVHSVFEGDANKRQPIERSRADDVNARRGVESDLHGPRVVTFHLLGREARRLGGNFQDDGRWIRIRLNVELLESNQPGAGKQQQVPTPRSRGGSGKMR